MKTDKELLYTILNTITNTQPNHPLIKEIQQHLFQSLINYNRINTNLLNTAKELVQVLDNLQLQSSCINNLKQAIKETELILPTPQAFMWEYTGNNINLKSNYPVARTINETKPDPHNWKLLYPLYK